MKGHDIKGEKITEPQKKKKEQRIVMVVKKMASRVVEEPR